MVAPEDIAPDYYLSHFETLLDLVWEHDRALFEAGECDVIGTYRACSRGARMLVVRLLSRRAAVKRDSLVYPEIEDTQGALGELGDAGLVATGRAVPEFVGPRACLERVTVAELRDAASGRGLDPAGRKPELIERLADDTSAVADLAHRSSLVCLTERPLLERLLVLFFGNRRQDLSTFVVELLEHTRYAPYEVSRATGPFPSRRELESYLAWSEHAELDPRELDLPELTALEEAATAALADDPHALAAHVAFVVARELERRSEHPRSIALYDRLVDAGSPDLRSQALDRLGLLGQRRGDLSSFQVGLSRTDRRDWDAVSRHRVARRASRVGLGTPPQLAAPQIIELELARAPSHRSRSTWGPAEQRDTVEEAALQALGGHGAYGENAIIRALFSLLLWDVVFAPVPGAFIQPFQSAPLDFGSPHFGHRRRGRIDGRLSSLRTADLAREIERTWAEHHGEACRWILWSHWELDLLTRSATALGPALVEVLGFIANHPVRHGCGFPDLLLWNEVELPSSARFVEVKAPGDQLRLEQRLTHDVLLRAGYPVDVVKVLAIDPGQE